MSKPEEFRCHTCGKVCTNQRAMCDRSEDDRCWCPKCFDKTPCGKGKHGEGCPTLIFNDGK